jgi:hypothetical protein
VNAEDATGRESERQWEMITVMIAVQHGDHKNNSCNALKCGRIQRAQKRTNMICSADTKEVPMVVGKRKRLTLIALAIIVVLIVGGIVGWAGPA